MEIQGVARGPVSGIDDGEVSETVQSLHAKIATSDMPRRRDPGTCPKVAKSSIPNRNTLDSSRIKDNTHHLHLPPSPSTTLLAELSGVSSVR